MKTNVSLLGVIIVGSIDAFFNVAAHGDTFGSGANVFDIDFVVIGNAGNAADPTTGYGAVPYEYRMGKYEISKDQITKAIASGAISIGTGGPWSANQPAGGMTWFQIAAYVNWLNTSTGHSKAYNVNAGSTGMTLWTPGDAGYDASNLFRNRNAFYFLPSDNEFYKAAYFDPNKPGGAGYWLYATGSDTAPTPVTGATATGAPGTAVYGVPISGSAQPAAVNLAGGPSPYGTVGQSGNSWDYLETASDGINDNPSEFRVERGGTVVVNFGGQESDLRSSTRGSGFPISAISEVGFRVASVPEPSSACLIGLSAFLLAGRRKRKDRVTG